MPDDQERHAFTVGDANLVQVHFALDASAIWDALLPEHVVGAAEPLESHLLRCKPGPASELCAVLAIASCMYCSISTSARASCSTAAPCEQACQDQPWSDVDISTALRVGFLPEVRPEGHDLSKTLKWTRGL